MTHKLTPDAKVPALSVQTLGGKDWNIAQQNPQNFSMVVFYRGYHCPVCKAYLGTLNRLAAAYKAAGFSILALSMNSAELAQKSADEWDLPNLTIGFGLSEKTATDWGLYISTAIKEAEAETFCEPGLFWVRPDGRLYLADVSNMPWARPDLEFLRSKIPFAVENKYPARGTKTV